MKRIFALFFAVCLLLCGCASEPEVTTVPTTTAAPTAAPTTQPTTEATTVPTTQATTEAPTEPPVLYRHPLNGAALEAPWVGRPTAVILNNIRDALPQHGNSMADVLFEVETEGGITRMLAIFSDVTAVDAIGPVRSSRTFYNNLALSFGAPLIHCGGSQFALWGWYSSNGDTISNWEHINEQTNGSYFYRDSYRISSGFSYEHTLFTDGESLGEALVDKGYHIPHETGTQYGMTFAEDVQPKGESAGKVVVTFRGGKTTTMQYDPQLKLYFAEQYGSPSIDGTTGETMSFSNVIVITTEQTFRADPAYNRSMYDLSGSGDGYLATAGTIVPIVWHRDELRSSFYYTYADGSPVELNVGKTYVAVVDNSRTVDYEP